MATRPAPDLSPQALAAAARAAAQALGFEGCGVATPASSPAAAAALERWLDAGRHGEMRYMDRQRSVRREPGRAWADARSAVVVLHNHYRRDADPAPGRGRIARYALGDDYHDVMRAKLAALGHRLVETAGAGQCRCYVDAGPLPERELARRAGLGWFGKNTMLIHPRIGSFTFIGVVLTDLLLEPDDPFEADRCGSCRRCLDACPTAAFPEPRVLDATRCLSYLTIESHRPMPGALASQADDRLFGCDVCQEVCPWNVRFARETAEPRYRARRPEEWPTLVEILRMNEREHEEAFGDTALERPGHAGLARNAAVVLENARRGKGGPPAA